MGAGKDREISAVRGTFRRWGPRALRGAAAVFGALLTVVILLEVGLQLAGWIALSARDRPAGSGGRPVVACVGDSWTYGVESGDVARLSYPAQLEQLITRRRGAVVRVLNRGEPGMPSGTATQQIESLLRKHRLDVVVLLVGGANWFDMDGVAERLGKHVPAPRSRLKLVRLAHMLAGDTGQQNNRHWDEGRRQVMQALRKTLAAAPTTSHQRGLPPLSVEGCPEPGARTRLLDELRAGRCKPSARLEALLQQRIACLAALTVAAETCLQHGNIPLATRLARRALGPGRNPRAVAALASALLARAAPLPPWLLQRLQRAVDQSPRSVLLLHALVQAEVREEINACTLLSDLGKLVRACGGCTWGRQAYSYLEKELTGPAANVLRLDYRRTLEACRRHGARLLLLNYPRSEVCACRKYVTGVIRRFATSHDVAYLDLAGVLGAYRGSREQYYDGGPRGGGHPNRHGYRVIAAAVADRLQKLGWLGARAR